MRKNILIPVHAIALLSLFACSPLPKEKAEPFAIIETVGGFKDEPVDYRDKEITVWYATNRKANEPFNSLEPYGHERDVKLNYGTCKVLIPKSHCRGSLGGSWVDRVFGKDAPIEFKGAYHLQGAAFWNSLRLTLENFEPSDRRVLVFIHGYNNSFVEAAQRTAQIWADIGVRGVPAFFSWPSKGGTSGIFHYIADEAAIEASEEYLAEFLIGIRDQIQAKDVHVIAHSMGNRALLRVVSSATEAAEGKTGKKFSQIFLAAPDIDLDVFNRLAGAYHNAAERTTLYVSKKDRAVSFSEGSLIHRYPRVGAPPPYAQVESLDTVEVEGPRGLLEFGHAFFAEYGPVLDDMYSLIIKNEPGQLRINKSGVTSTGAVISWQVLGK